MILSNQSAVMMICAKPHLLYIHKAANTPAEATINHRASGSPMAPAPEFDDDDPVCNDAPVPDAVDEDPPRAVDVLCEPVAPVESAPVPVAVVSAAAVIEAESPDCVVAAASLPASELAAVVGDPLCWSSPPAPAEVASGLLPPSEEPSPAAAEVGALLLPWGDVCAAGGAFSGVVVAAAGAVAGTVASVVGGTVTGARVVAKLEVDWTLTQSRS